MMKILVSIMILLSWMTGFSQTGVMRLEFEAAINSNIYNLIPLENRGFLLFYETTAEVDKDSKNWMFAFFDPSFAEVWKTAIPIAMGVEYMNYEVKDSLLHIFFLNPDKVRQHGENYQWQTIDLVNGISYGARGLLPPESSFCKMAIAGNRLAVALNMKDEQAALFVMESRSDTIYDYYIKYPDQNFFEDLVYDPDKNQLVGIITNYLSRKQNKMYLVAFAPDAQMVSDLEILPVLENKYLNTAKAYITDKGKYLIMGAYGNVAAKIASSSDYFGTESAGVFSTRINGQRQEFMNYYNFMEFRNLRAGVSARDFYRLQKKKDRESGEYSLNYELVLHDPGFYDSTYVLSMEVFYPEFRSVSDISYDYWGRPITHTYTVFEGFKFFNSILVGFNEDGEMAWDNSIEINLPPTMLLNQKSSYYFDNEPVIMFYNDGSDISYRIYLENAELESFNNLDIETSEFGDKINTTGQNYIIHWYDNYFLAYGYHTIRNNKLIENNERTVFYINKISLE